MTSHVARLYALVAGVVVFFVAWAAIAAHPWAPRAAQDPRIAALAARQQHVQLESLRVQKLVAARQLAAVRQQNATTSPAALTTAAAPAVRVVNLPPLVITRTS